MRLPGGTLSVNQTLPPIEESRPIVIDDGMARIALAQFPVSADFEALRPQRDRLIDANVAADHRRFANYNARAVIDEKTFTDLGAGMDVDTGERVRNLVNDPR
jgi:hypothetical protein